jgi:hypothetical protein
LANFPEPDPHISCFNAEHCSQWRVGSHRPADIIVAASNRAITHSAIAGRHFGIENLPICGTCQRPMQFARRTPHPIFGDDYELQLFECRTCGRQNRRSADAGGLPHHGGVLLT